MENNMEKDFRPATKRQLYALYCITKQDYRNSNLSFEEASNLIQKYGNSNYIKKEKLSENEKFMNYMKENIHVIVDKINEFLKHKEVLYDEITGKKYAFFGFGCGFVWFEYDKRSKKTKYYEDLFYNNLKTIKKLILKQFDNKTLKEYEKLGFPLSAFVEQDEQTKLELYYLVREYMIQNGCKNVSVLSRPD